MASLVHLETNSPNLCVSFVLSACKRFSNQNKGNAVKILLWVSWFENSHLKLGPGALGCVVMWSCETSVAYMAMDLLHTGASLGHLCMAIYPTEACVYAPVMPRTVGNLVQP